jgi:hypothetical protein
MNPLTRDLLQGSFVWPNALINETGPLPIAPPGQMGTPDGLINKSDQTKLLQNGLLDMIYSYGPNPARITTQTQNNIPNKVQRIIAKLFVPAAQTEAGTYQDPILEHATNDGDLVFTLKINRQMAEDSTRYVLYPAGYSHGAVKLINLATLNYLLWGLQVGTQLQGGNSMWLRFFNQLCKADHQPLLSRLQLNAANSGTSGEHDEEVLEMVWNFVRSYVSPYGIQHGFDTQGGQHEGSRTRVVTNAVDYVSSFAVEGKLLKVNNLWKACDVYEDDDLVLSLRYVPPRPFAIPFNLSSSNRSHRAENAPAHLGWWCLTPEVLLFKSLVDTPHIHIGRSQKMVTSYANPQFGNDMPQWNARAALGGTPLQITFEPCYMDSDKLFLKKNMLYLRLNESGEQQQQQEAQAAAADVRAAGERQQPAPITGAYKRIKIAAAPAAAAPAGGGGGGPPRAAGPLSPGRQRMGAYEQFAEGLRLGHAGGAAAAGDADAPLDADTGSSSSALRDDGSGGLDDGAAGGAAAGGAAAGGAARGGDRSGVPKSGNKGSGKRPVGGGGGNP